MLEKKEREIEMQTVEITPSYLDYQNYFHKMSDELLTVWIEVAERRLPTYRRKSDLLSVALGIRAARSVQRLRENNWE
ncbi:MAG: hypothetical protein EBT51_11285 [Flavobacteriaceae bacterium]|nr:hypothetical protein [Flavobacteriaceae bacterium]